MAAVLVPGRELEEGPTESGGAGTPGATGPTGATGPDGATGPAGQGVPTGGTTGQVLAKIDATNYNTQWIPAPSGLAYTYSSTAPVSPAVGDFWVDSSSGVRYQYVNDGTSSQWVEF